jgi:hypothetical protein
VLQVSQQPIHRHITTNINDLREPNHIFIQLSSYSTPMTTKHRCPPFAASQLPQILLAIFRHVYLMEVAGVDVFPPPHMNYLI